MITRTAITDRGFVKDGEGAGLHARLGGSLCPLAYRMMSRASKM